MPIYEYRCKKGHSFEVMQRMSDDALTECTTCGAPVQRVFHPVAVHFKGKGFYTTDYGKGGTTTGSQDGKPDSDSGSDKSDAKKKDDSDSASAKKDGASKDGAAKKPAAAKD